MSKLEKDFMKKITVYLFIANLGLMTSNSLCMLTVLSKSTFRPSKTTPYIQRRSFTSTLPLSKERYAAICKENKKNKERLQSLRQDPYANLREIWRLEDKIKSNRRILAASNLKILDETTE